MNNIFILINITSYVECVLSCAINHSEEMDQTYITNRTKIRFDYNERIIINLDGNNNVPIEHDIFGAIFTYPIDNTLHSTLGSIVDEFSLLFSGDIPVHQGIILRYDNTDPSNTIVLHYGADEDNSGPKVERMGNIVRVASGEVKYITIYEYPCHNDKSINNLVKYLYEDGDGILYGNEQELSKVYNVISNGRNRYNIITCNCQHFVNEVLQLHHYNQGDILSDVVSIYHSIKNIMTNVNIDDLIKGYDN